MKNNIIILKFVINTMKYDKKLKLFKIKINISGI